MASSFGRCGKFPPDLAARIKISRPPPMADGGDGFIHQLRLYDTEWRPGKISWRIENNDPRVSMLSISGNGRYNISANRDLGRLGAAIGNNTKLKALSFSSNDSGHFLTLWEKDEEELFRGVALNRSIEEMSFTNFKHANGDMFFYLNPFFEGNRNLRRLEIHYCDMSRKCKRLFALALAKSSSLTHFDYTGDPDRDSAHRGEFDDDEAERLVLAAAGHPRLKTLILKNCPVLMGEGNDSPASLAFPIWGRLASLDLTRTEMGDRAASALASALGGNKALSRLILAYNPGISMRGWGEIFEVLEGGRLAITYLNLRGNVVLGGGTPGMGDGHSFAARLASSLRDSRALRTLDLSFNGGIAGSGWVALSSVLLQSASLALETLLIYGGLTVDSSVLISFASSLSTNGNLRELHVGYGDWQGEGWKAISHSLCNSSSIMDTFLSNHTLGRATSYNSEGLLPDSLQTSLRWNRDFGKFDAARLKIIKCHFMGNYDMRHFVGMDPGVSPHVIAWMGKEVVEDSTGAEIGGLPLLYPFVRNMHHLLNYRQSNTSKNSPRRRRKSPRLK